MLLLLALAAAVPLASAAPTTRGVPQLAHVIVVVFENRERDQVAGSSAAEFSALARRYVDLRDYYAVAHPSLPNYLALVSGSTQGITTDCTTCTAAGASIGTLLTRAHESWGAYAEGYPSSPLFAKKHEPFLYFKGQEAHVFPLSKFDPAHLPRFAFVSPNLCHDMHDCSTAVGSEWLARFMKPLLAAPSTAIFIVFDEGSSDSGGGGHVFAVLAGTAVRSHVAYTRRTGHYGLLRTIEDGLGLRHLGESARTKLIEGVWR